MAVELLFCRVLPPGLVQFCLQYEINYLSQWYNFLQAMQRKIIVEQPNFEKKIIEFIEKHTRI